MTNTTALQRAVELSSITKLADACEISPAAFRKWLNKNGLPMSDLTGETDYAHRIEWAIMKCGADFLGLDLIRERLPDMKPGIVYRLPLILFSNDPNQPRKQFDNIKLEALALTLGHDGQETPIKVTVDMDGDKPLIITHGERRWRAAYIAQLTHLDCMLDTKATDESAADKIFRQAADNTGEQLSKWDWACTIRDLSEQHGMTDHEISDALGRRGFDGFSRPVVANLRRLFKLPKDAQKLIEWGWLTPSHGKHLLAIKHEPVLQDVIHTLVAAHNMGDNPPTINTMEIDTRDHYANLYPDPENYWEDPHTGEEYEDLPSEVVEAHCDKCEHLHTTILPNGYQNNYCTNLQCYKEKQKAELQKRVERVRQHEAQELEHPDEQRPPATEHPASIPAAPVTHSAPTSTATPSATSPQIAADAYREMLIDRTKRLRQAVRDVDLNTQLAILCMSAFCEDSPPMTIQQSMDRLNANKDDLIQLAAVSVLDYLESERLADLREYLNVPDVSQETEQSDLRETA